MYERSSNNLLKDLSGDSYHLLLASDSDKHKVLYLELEVDKDETAFVKYLVEKYDGLHNPTIHFTTLGAACRAYDEI